MDIALIGNTALRSAIQRNLVSFPSQVPSFMRRQTGDRQERIVQLYFVRAWSVRAICDRYRLSRAMVQKLLSEWRIRAIAAGYIQDIHPDVLEILAQDYELCQQEAHEQAGLDVDFTTPDSGWHMTPPPQPDHIVSVAGGV